MKQGVGSDPRHLRCLVSSNRIVHGIINSVFEVTHNQCAVPFGQGSSIKNLRHAVAGHHTLVVLQAATHTCIRPRTLIVHSAYVQYAAVKRLGEEDTPSQAAQT
jgi:hypothetical protein